MRRRQTLIVTVQTHDYGSVLLLAGCLLLLLPVPISGAVPGYHFPQAAAFARIRTAGGSLEADIHVPPISTAGDEGSQVWKLLVATFGLEEGLAPAVTESSRQAISSKSETQNGGVMVGIAAPPYVQGVSPPEGTDPPAEETVASQAASVRGRRLRRQVSDIFFVGKRRHGEIAGTSPDNNIVNAHQGSSRFQRFSVPAVTNQTGNERNESNSNSTMPPTTSSSTSGDVITTTSNSTTVTVTTDDASSSARNQTDEIRSEIEELFGVPQCNRGEHFVTITREGCEPRLVDVGSCSGFCRSWFIPKFVEEGVTPDSWFKRGKCKCCAHRKLVEREVTLTCESGVDQLVQVPIVVSCHCKKCRG